MMLRSPNRVPSSPSGLPVNDENRCVAAEVQDWRLKSTVAAGTQEPPLKHSNPSTPVLRSPLQARSKFALNMSPLPEFNVDSPVKPTKLHVSVSAVSPATPHSLNQSTSAARMAPVFRPFTPTPVKRSARSRLSLGRSGGKAMALQQTPIRRTTKYAKQVRELKKQLATLKEGWQDRVRALVEVQRLCTDLAQQSWCNERLLVYLLYPIAASVATQLTDLRSKVIKEACRTISTLASSIKKAFDPFLQVFAHGLARLVHNTKVAMRVPADECMVHVVAHSIISAETVCGMMRSSKHPKTKHKCLRYLHMMIDTWQLQTPTMQFLPEALEFAETGDSKEALLARSIGLVQAALADTLEHRSLDVRGAARELFARFYSAWQVDAAAVFFKLELSTQRTLLKEHPCLDSIDQFDPAGPQDKSADSMRTPARRAGSSTRFSLSGRKVPLSAKKNTTTRPSNSLRSVSRPRSTMKRVIARSPSSSSSYAQQQLNASIAVATPNSKPVFASPIVKRTPVPSRTTRAPCSVNKKPAHGAQPPSAAIKKKSAKTARTPVRRTPARVARGSVRRVTSDASAGFQRTPTHNRASSTAHSSTNKSLIKSDAEIRAMGQSGMFSPVATVQASRISVRNTPGRLVAKGISFTPSKQAAAATPSGFESGRLVARTPTPATSAAAAAPSSFSSLKEFLSARDSKSIAVATTSASSASRAEAVEVDQSTQEVRERDIVTVSLSPIRFPSFAASPVAASQHTTPLPHTTPIHNFSTLCGTVSPEVLLLSEQVQQLLETRRNPAVVLREEEKEEEEKEFSAAHPPTDVIQAILGHSSVDEQLSSSGMEPVVPVKTWTPVQAAAKTIVSTPILVNDTHTHTHDESVCVADSFVIEPAFSDSSFDESFVLAAAGVAYSCSGVDADTKPAAPQVTTEQKEDSSNLLEAFAISVNQDVDAWKQTQQRRVAWLAVCVFAVLAWVLGVFVVDSSVPFVPATHMDLPFQNALFVNENRSSSSHVDSSQLAWQQQHVSGATEAGEVDTVDAGAEDREQLAATPTTDTHTQQQAGAEEVDNNTAIPSSAGVAKYGKGRTNDVAVALEDTAHGLHVAVETTAPDVGGDDDGAMDAEAERMEMLAKYYSTEQYTQEGNPGEKQELPTPRTYHHTSTHAHTQEHTYFDDVMSHALAIMGSSSQQESEGVSESPQKCVVDECAPRAVPTSQDVAATAWYSELHVKAPDTRTAASEDEPAENIIAPIVDVLEAPEELEIKPASTSTARMEPAAEPIVRVAPSLHSLSYRVTFGDEAETEATEREDTSDSAWLWEILLSASGVYVAMTAAGFAVLFVVRAWDGLVGNNRLPQSLEEAEAMGMGLSSDPSSSSSSSSSALRKTPGRARTLRTPVAHKHAPRMHSQPLKLSMVETPNSHKYAEVPVPRPSTGRYHLRSRTPARK